MTKMTIKTAELIQDLRQADEEFDENCADESEKWTMSFYLGDAQAPMNSRFPEGEKFQLIETWNEKGDGKDESTDIGIFMRKSDNKYFQFWVHDRGFIGPITLSMCEEMEEVFLKTETIIKKTWE